MNPSFEREFEMLVDKFAELLTGSSDPETVRKVKLWALYSHMHKSMPAMTNHWGQSHPESKQEMRKLFEEIRALNEAARAARGPSGSSE